MGCTEANTETGHYQVRGEGEQRGGGGGRGGEGMGSGRQHWERGKRFAFFGGQRYEQFYDVV